MSEKIESISIKYFRGATIPATVTFDKAKKSTVIFGENGTGKSTIVDAIDFVANQNFGSLKDFSGVGKHESASIGKSPSDIEIILSVGGKKFTGRCGGKAPECSPAIGIPQIAILRRAKILDLVTATPGDRYSALKKFIDIEVVRTNELALYDAAKSIDAKYNSSVERFAQAKEELVESWNDAKKPLGTCAAWAKAQLAVSVDEKKDLLKKYQTMVSALTATEQSIEQLKLKRQFKNEKEVSHKETSGALAAAQQANGQSSDLITLLEEAESFLKKSKTQNECPVCERNYEGNLLEVISGRLSKMSELAAKIAAEQKNKTELLFAEKNLVAAQRDLILRGSNLFAICCKSELPQVKALKLDWSANKIPTGQDSSFTLDIENNLIKLFDAPISIKSTLLSDATALTGEIENHNAIQRRIKDYALYGAQVTKYDAMRKKGNALYALVQKIRKDFERQVLTSLEGRVNTLFSTLHPGERITFKAFELSEKGKSGAVDIKSDFWGHEVPPQGYFSESHLDTLGICIFIALAEKKGQKIVVLDDVLTSVDFRHLDRFMDLFVKEFAPNFDQIILTTHYDTWRKKIYGRSSLFSLIELSPKWNVANGIYVYSALSNAEDLKALVLSRERNTQPIASKGGIQAENIFHLLSEKFRIPLPMSDGNRHTMGEYAVFLGKHCSKKKLTITRKEAGGDKTTDLLPLINSIGTRSYIRNEDGCHYCVDETVPYDDVLAFGTDVVTLTDMFLCPNAECKSFPEKIHGNELSCPCGGCVVKLV